ncbi:Complement component C1q receptor C1q/MBL/SPA receptor [Collichthys lucidus]|uniref:Complement component C1q receptor C1q/MBL/SPA receptor n=1 Tax=Collichthys lucidus TaxID=240159 RepID=A0A4U5VEF2_COLLU|nr:Complement component C1q receptor C1q/MBL/SPA receptor [Collichthys lucidus]
MPKGLVGPETSGEAVKTVQSLPLFSTAKTELGTSGSSNLLISMAVMLFLVLLLTNSFEGISGAAQETLCTSNACYTLNMVNGSFEAANQNYGIYHWKDPGPFCKQNCMINNGGCEHLCHSGTDQVHCSCKEGYSLDKNGFTCRTKELCPNGFQLDADQSTCSDIDECQSQICEHLCINTHGNYTCVCKDGYQMVGGKCSDIDECTQRKCEHGCSNSIGSYSCYCSQGFTLSEDGHSCVDTNECVSNPCHFKCVNTNGSFLCTCPQGFHVETDGLTCTPEVTETSVPSSESLTRTTVELQHQSPHTDAPPPELVNITQSNTSSVASFAKTFNSRVIICVLGSVIPLLILVAVTLAIMIFRCSRTKKEAKKNTTTDGYCWVSSGLDPRLEKLYESILTDDL